MSIWSEVGEHSIIAEGCIVKMSQRIPSGVVACGNPADVIREVTQEDKDRWAQQKQLYIDLAQKYLRLGMSPIG